MPPGFEANVFASGLSGPRFIAFGPDGALYVADRGNGRIATLPDTNQDGVADAIHTFADGLTQPHSLTYHEGAWYVGVPTGVIRLVDENGDGTADSRETLIDDYPTNGHSTRTVLFLTDGRMVVSVGSSCNVCEEDDPRRAAVLVYDDGNATNEQIFASGLRNAVGLALHPQTGELWATNNGRDMLGDNTPPETVYIVREGEAYGWPVCHSGDIIDPDLGHAGDCDGVTAPIVEMQAHSAPLGLAFYTGTQFPAEYQGDLFVAFHGSWNRREPTGYKVVRIPLNGSTPTGAVEDFATGWLSLEENVVYGRPVGLAVGPDGALYVSDDKGGYIYRISYRGS
ncbi:MAG: sorbosone dehydrogenase family protein [Ardenticatenaceae bacterium]|nr:sorbosone dehydrogenase family protein [Ardenticatenaceae bacterium]MCB9005703.1 sorbosone dehydrogenase family protein [Ardenticatenaceae bacterium]